MIKRSTGLSWPFLVLSPESDENILMDKIDKAWVNQIYVRGVQPGIFYFVLGIVVAAYRFNSVHYDNLFVILGISLSVTSIIRGVISYLGAKELLDQNKFLIPLKSLILLNGLLWTGIFGLVAYESDFAATESVINFGMLIGICSAGPTSMIALPLIQPIFLGMITLVPAGIYATRYVEQDNSTGFFVMASIMALYCLYTISHGRQLRRLLQESFENHYKLVDEKEVVSKTLQELTKTQEALLVEKEKTSELVSTVQSFFLPEKSFFKTKKLSLSAYFAAATDASGDWWWYSPKENEGIFLLLGDVTGHGAASAMLTASTASQLQLLKKINPNIEVGEVLTVLNREFSNLARGKYLMTMSAIEIDDQMKVRWWNAAAPPIFIIKKNGESDEITLPSHPLGVTDFELSNLDLNLEEGDRLILYTDGLTELELPDGNQIRFRVLKDIFLKTRGMSTADAINHITDSIHTLRKGHPLSDDITMVLVDCVG